MPLPPQISRAQATVSRALDVQNALATDACGSVSLPSSYSWAMRATMHWQAVMLLIILARISWNICNLAIGLSYRKPSSAYLNPSSYAPNLQPDAIPALA